MSRLNPFQIELTITEADEEYTFAVDIVPDTGRDDSHWKIKEGAGFQKGLHFPTKKSVKKYFEKKGYKAKII